MDEQHTTLAATASRSRLYRKAMKHAKPTIYQALCTKLGRQPTNAELKAEVTRIKQDAVIELAQAGKLPHQKR
jgi:aconitase B